MITSFKIIGFKGFRELEFPHLSRITLLGGQNNVGKTSILEALFTFFDRFNPQMILRQFAWRGVDALPLDPEIIWAPVFNRYDMSRDITLSAVIDGRREAMTLRFNPNYANQAIPAQVSIEDGRVPTIKTDQPPMGTFALDIRFSAEDKPEQTAHLVLGLGKIQFQVDYMEFGGPFAAFIGLRMRESPNEIATRFGQLDVIGKQDAILQFLQLSNDNPYSEAQFQTLQYRPQFPEQFGCKEDAEGFCGEFFDWYNTEHRHSGIAMLTPETVHYGKAQEAIAQRQSVLEAAYAQNPQRFVRHAPKHQPLPEAVWINPPETGRAVAEPGSALLQ